MKCWSRAYYIYKCFSLHQSGTVMKSITIHLKTVAGFSLHQSGTVMKSLTNTWITNPGFSLHQSGTVMK